MKHSLYSSVKTTTFNFMHTTSRESIQYSYLPSNRLGDVEFLFSLSSDAREHSRSSLITHSLRESTPARWGATAAPQHPAILRRHTCSLSSLPIEPISPGAREPFILPHACSYGSCPRVPPNLSPCHHASPTIVHLTQINFHP
jgi:hypothetical protein